MNWKTVETVVKKFIDTCIRINVLISIVTYVKYLLLISRNRLSFVKKSVFLSLAYMYTLKGARNGRKLERK